MAQAMTWVKLTRGCPVESRCLLSSRRFSSSVRTGMVRAEVAVGTDRLASMFSTARTAPPRIGCSTSPGRIGTRASARDRSAGTSGDRGTACSSALGRGVPPASDPGCGAGSDARPLRVSKYVRQPGSTAEGSLRYCSSRSRAKT